MQYFHLFLSDLSYLYLFLKHGSIQRITKVGKRKSRIEDDEDEEEKTELLKPSHVVPRFPQGTVLPLSPCPFGLSHALLFILPSSFNSDPTLLSPWISPCHLTLQLPSHLLTHLYPIFATTQHLM